MSLLAAGAAARELAAQLVGIAAAELDGAAAAALLAELCGTFAPPGAGPDGDAGARTHKHRARYEDVDGSLAAAGYVLAQCAAGAWLAPSAPPSRWPAWYTGSCQHVCLLLNTVYWANWE